MKYTILSYKKYKVNITISSYNNMVNFQLKEKTMVGRSESK